ncbi:hypothetical protein BRYFOR_08934 [Marvinbryantia formatexigens DSM 14469]|uniref:Uncharacterized protein n=1 Tax=Marvinbryantia formatexigens DSM 14469 TaxID=478749 RepID=C6LJU7_9FIRM|nr:hypothetical protein [Marvinbryantia formatexigens]EET59025.1 hypothetical protein BRYFOR_08934 [Marvinbryantia formatexigens DSM 14469]UWO23570.1 hypothetical protein NQ534_14060 [Marvinbryantia formatexigens DSM 14469]SDG84533.1 hypothetical protein SAMN05660368_03395 [Marvinbryantia formatexigens]
MMKKRYKKATALALTAGVICSMGVTISAATNAEYTKNENIYVRLEQDGQVDGVYVVNSFDVTKAGEISDYGDYAAVYNLTNLDEIVSDKEEQTFEAEEGKFYYQGNIEKAELPWTFEIVYTLDGDQVEGEELEGAEGELEMQIHIRKNPSFTEDAFFNTCLLQATVTLDSELCDNIAAEKTTLPTEEGTEPTVEAASIADAGGNEQITFTVNPGTETDLTVKTDVENFEMDDISIAGVPTGAVVAQDENAENAENAETADEGSQQTLSFTSAENKHTDHIVFAISAPGVKIPDPVATKVIEEKISFLEKVKSLFE